MEEAIEFGLRQLKYEHIRDNQKKAVFGYLNDMICSCEVQFLCSPTGSGKLLTFEIAPFVFSFMHHKDQLLKLTSSVIVISPLVSLMESQVLKLKSLGLTAVFLPNIKALGLVVSDKKIFSCFLYISLYKTCDPWAGPF